MLAAHLHGVSWKLSIFCAALILDLSPLTIVLNSMLIPRTQFFGVAFFLVASANSLLSPTSFRATAATPEEEFSQLRRSFVVNGRTIDTKSYLQQAWEAKGRPGLFSNGGMDWDGKTRDWRVKPGLPPDYFRGIAYYASFTAPAGSIAVSIAGAYHEPELMDELAKFYTAFLHANFTTLGDLRKTSSPQIKQKQLGVELGPDSTRTLAWWQEADGGVILRECYLCNEQYFIPVAGLIELIARLKPAERTPAMAQFVSEYVPILVHDHILRLNFAQEMREQMSHSGQPKRPNMSEEEIGAVNAAAGLLGADAADRKLIALTADDRARLKDLVKTGVERFQFSRTLTTDSQGRLCAVYFAGDYDGTDDFQFANYEGEKFPTATDKTKVKNKAWDTGHFNVVPAFLRTLYDHRDATGVDFPKKTDLELVANQYVYHVFEGDYKAPLFTNFFDGTDGWYRVSYLGRSGYGIAPSRYCSTFDRSHTCLLPGAAFDWGLLAPFHAGLAKTQLALLELARSKDPAIACFEPQCFRERYYRYADFSFSFVDAVGSLQYPPALLILLSQWAAASPEIHQTRS